MILDEREALRYLGFRNEAPDERTAALVRELGEAFLSALSPKHIYKKYAVEVTESAVLLDGWRIESAYLVRNLAGCGAAYLFAATLGLEADRRIRTETARSEARGAAAHAVCNALIESYIDEVHGALDRAERAAGAFTRPRFSPGYGDVPLSAQREIFARLHPEKTIGVTLTDSLLMVPVKSVTAFIGVTRDPARAARRFGEGDE